ncbi:UDP-N-acetylglucosamine 1-carboxyvinyltransferase [sediment metagenome]|uniref:UDP-N-acetylglucosamine 1-carboxyvinyltransferase n=1 Tax=sediment metagenome TaxID=749907 RepID=D9PNH1_9ZZZZ
MSKFIIGGGISLKGEVKVSGSKNAALPILCASLLTTEKSVFKNVPDIDDIHSVLEIFKALGAEVKYENHTVMIDPKNMNNDKVPEHIISKMRASILIIGALINRFKEISIPFPGGCVLGKRSVSAHMDGFEELGCKIIDDKERLHIKAKKLTGKKIILQEQSVTATENLLMATVLAEGHSEIRMAATEPHIRDLCLCLRKMGAKISGVGSSELRIKGVKKLKGVTYTIQGDYLEAGTFAIAAVATKGDVVIKGINTDYLDALWQKFKEIGAPFRLKKNEVHILPYKRHIKAVAKLRTAVYPAFPTDLQAPFTVLLTQSHGVSKIFETLFEGRLNYLFELEQMGAYVEYLNPHQALVIGPKKLKGRPISSYDIRAGAAMIIAALIAEGTTEISNIKYIDRGYEDIDMKLKKLGANITRIMPFDNGNDLTCDH